MSKSSGQKRYVWIFTVCFALLAIVTAISCLMVYLIDKSLLNALSGTDTQDINDYVEDEELVTDAGVVDDAIHCTPLSCKPECITEWWDGNFTCELGINIGPVDYRHQSPTKTNHKPKLLSSRKLLKVAGLSNIERMFSVELDPLLIPRVSGTPGSVQARRHIIQRLETLGGWAIDQDAFSAPTPFGDKDFVNIVATLNPSAERRLVLACHYDSKYFAPRQDNRQFIGATDSAVPCAMLLDLAYSLNDILKASPLEMVTLQLVFFDGEEAFRTWTDTDSLYGSRHLAALWADPNHNPRGTTKAGTTELDRIDMLVLLDLIGERNPQFHDHFPSQTGKWFQHMQKVEQRLHTNNLLESHSRNYFTRSGSRYGGIEDDHIPFIRRDVACFHVIATPFPATWHKMEDTKEALDMETIDNLNKMFQVFTAEYLHLKIPAIE